MKHKRLVIVFFIFVAVAVFAGSLFAYDFVVAGVSLAGSAIGAYSGQLLSVPVLMMFSGMGLIEEDIFSPFSTAMYDGMDWGSGVGCVIGGLASKYIYLAVSSGDWDWQSFALDSLSTTLIVVATHFIFGFFGEDLGVSPFVSNVAVSPILSGMYLGFIIPSG